jgi:hypothetical protein
VIHIVYLNHFGGQDHVNKIWNNLLNFKDIGFRLNYAGAVLEKMEKMKKDYFYQIRHQGT